MTPTAPPALPADSACQWCGDGGMIEQVWGAGVRQWLRRCVDRIGCRDRVTTRRSAIADRLDAEMAEHGYLRVRG